jgi:hypothetical protein
MNFLDKLPVQVKERALHMFMDCHELISKVDPKEESCKSYEPMLQCSQGVINKVNHAKSNYNLNSRVN